MKLGAFELGEPIGHGGMGSVWRGEHVEEGIDVAVKVMRPDVMDDPDYREAFDTEVRSVASLNHPNIITILDFGRVPDDVAERAGEAIATGSPYLVMEYGHGGGVHDYFSELRWPDLRELLLITLDALAHAHARDVIHRDLKPENILVGCGPGWDVKLTDFGLAHATDRFNDSGKVETAWGTPQYMAPEQLRGLWREYGPWTDLYGLGCMAWELLCGEFLYDGEAMMEIAEAHIEAPIPELTPRFDIPAGTEEWIRRLLAKDRKNRFQHAADAAYALAQLPALEDREQFGVLFEPPRQNGEEHQEGHGPATVVLSDVELSAASDVTTTRRETPAPMDVAASTPDTDVAGDQTPSDTPPLPLDWRRDDNARIPDELIGISQDLFGLRAIPLVDRDEERDRLWELLHRVHDDKKAHHILLEGAAGTGKSQLVQWFVRRAREVGAAHVLTAYHSPVGGGADGLVPMVERFLKCTRLDDQARREHLAELLLAEGLASAIDLQTLLPLFDGRGADGESSTGSGRRRGGPTGRSERYALIYQLLAAMARRRPVMVWLDDIQWGWDALGFAHYLHRRQKQDPAPILVAMTARTEALEQRPTERRLVRTLLDEPEVDHMALSALTRDDTEELVRQLLRLEEGLAENVLDRSEGVPLFAVQLVEDWVSRGKLVMGADGFELRPDTDLALPDDLHRLWDDRIDGFADAGPEGTRRQLEVAAALGQEVDRTEWERAVAEAGMTPAADLMERLVEAGLAEPIDGGWSFVHGMLAESLERRAQEAGRWGRWNGSCARAIAALHSMDAPYVPDRLAWHRLEAGQIEQGLDALAMAIDQAIERSDYDHAIDLIDWRDTVTVKTDPRRQAVSGIDRARVALNKGEFHRAVELASPALQIADDNDAPDLGARAALAAGVGHRGLGDLEDAEAMLQRARRQFERSADRHRLADTFLALGRVEEQRGDYQQALKHFRQARDVYAHLDDTYGQALSWNGEGDLFRHVDDREAATEASRRALELFRQLGNITGIADSLNDLAQLRRLEGDFDAAHQFSDEALRLYTAVDSEQRHLVRLNRAMIALQTGQTEQAGQAFENLIDLFDAAGREAPLVVAAAGLAAVSARRGDWQRARHVIELLEQRLEQTSVRPPEMRRAIDIARECASDAGEAELAERLAETAGAVTAEPTS